MIRVEAVCCVVLVVNIQVMVHAWIDPVCYTVDYELLGALLKQASATL
ncbi:hypothetical protein NSS79_15650 [Paenibacillus sp. FSL L8-0436]